VTEALRDVLGDDESPRSPVRGTELDRRRRPLVPALYARELVNEPAGLVDARLRLGCSRFRTSAQPLDLSSHAVRERLLPPPLLVQRGVLPREEFAIAALGLEETARVDGIEIEHALRRVLEEPAVVADDEVRARVRAQELLEPEDAV